MFGDVREHEPVPQMFKPMLDLYANEDSFTGRQIETRGMENLSKSERIDAEHLGARAPRSSAGLRHVTTPIARYRPTS
jgi:hypothetical protein